MQVSQFTCWHCIIYSRIKSKTVHQYMNGLKAVQFAGWLQAKLQYSCTMDYFLLHSRHMIADVAELIPHQRRGYLSLCYQCIALTVSSR